MIEFRIIEFSDEKILFETNSLAVAECDEEIIVNKNRLMHVMHRLTHAYDDYEVRFYVG